MSLCYHDGGLRPQAEATLPALSQAARYGLSAFEGIRLYRPEGGGAARPLALPAHLARLARSAGALGLPEASIAEAPAAVAALLAASPQADDAYLRVAISAASGGPLGSPTEGCVTATLAALGRQRWLAQRQRMRVTLGPWRRAAADVVPHHLKVAGAYVGGHLALRDARRRGFDSCVLLDAAGNLCEAPTAALFVVAGNRLLTPSLASGCLPSITRDILLALAPTLGLLPEERVLPIEALAAADEAFLAGTAIELAPIGEVDGHPLPAATPATEGLVAAYFAAARGGA